MVIKFSDQYYDYVEFVWVDSFATRFWVILSRVVFFLPMFALILINPQGLGALDLYLNPCMFIVGLAAFFGSYYAAWLRWKARMKREDQTTCEISETGLRATTPNTDALLLWADITKYTETSTLFLLRLPNGRFYFIPKRAFTSKTQQQIFRDLLRRKTGHQKPEVLESNYLAGDIVSAPYDLSFADYLESYRAISSPSYRLLLLIIRVSLIGFIGWRLRGNDSFIPVLYDDVETGSLLRKYVATGLFLFAWVIWLIPIIGLAFSNYLMAFHQWCKQPRKQQVSVDNEGVHVKLGATLNSFTWHFMADFVETQNLFLMCPSKRKALPIPKRAFSEEHLQRFRTCLSQRLA